MGLKMSDVGAALGAMLGGGYVNYFGLDGRSYKVIPQVQQRFRLNPSQVLDYYIRTAGGASVPLSTIARVVTQTRAGVAQPLPAAQCRDDPGRGGAGRDHGHRDELPGRPCRAHAAAGLHGRLRRTVPPVEAGIRRLPGHLRLRADHHLPVAGRAVRKLPRSVHHPGLGADVDRRRTVLRRTRRQGRQPQHLYRGRTGHADGADQQARHPDRRVRQQAAARRAAASARRSRRRPASGCARS